MSRSRSTRALELLLIGLGLAAGAVKIHRLVWPASLEHFNQRELARIARDQGAFSFVVMGDSRNAFLTLRQLTDLVNREPILFSIHLGDMIFNSGDAQYRFIVKQLRNFREPILTVIGNHELNDDEARGRENYLHYFGPGDYAFTVGDSCLIVLDNAEGALEPAQMAWLRAELEKSRTARYRFVFAHVPLDDPRDQPKRYYGMKDRDQAQALNRLLDEYQVTMLFVSHLHAYYRGVWGKTPFLLTGGAGATLSHTDADHEFNHYLRVDVSAAGVEYRVIKFDPAWPRLLDRFLFDCYILAEGYGLECIICLSAGGAMFVHWKTRRRRPRPALT